MRREGISPLRTRLKLAGDQTSDLDLLALGEGTTPRSSVGEVVGGVGVSRATSRSRTDVSVTLRSQAQFDTVIQDILIELRSKLLIL